MAGHDVGIALDHHNLLLLGNFLSRQVDSVEHLRLVIHGGIAGVEVLWPGVVIE